MSRTGRRRGATRDNGRQGTGTGLFISRGIVDAHGGRLWADSEPGRGSAFRFTLPLLS
jgi:signal transduction histidine kinase